MATSCIATFFVGGPCSSTAFIGSSPCLFMGDGCSTCWCQAFGCLHSLLLNVTPLCATFLVMVLSSLPQASGWCHEDINMLGPFHAVAQSGGLWKHEYFAARALLPALKGLPPGYTAPDETRWTGDRCLFTGVIYDDGSAYEGQDADLCVAGWGLVANAGTGQPVTVSGTLPFLIQDVDGAELFGLYMFLRIAHAPAQYHSRRNQFARFRAFLELTSRFEFEFCRRGNFFFLTIRIFGVFKVPPQAMWPYMCLCCGLFVPTQFHFECCGFRDDS